jgi:hypothetical protein
MRIFRSLLLIGGLFNFAMGLIFFNDRFLAAFLQLALRAEFTIFSRPGLVFFPQDPVHRMLIHGFGAAALILGATLIYAYRDPLHYIAFILFDGVGRILYGTLMIIYAIRYSLLLVILSFGIFELSLGIAYVTAAVLSARQRS